MILEMGTTARHNNILSKIYSDILRKLEDLFYKKQAAAYQEQVALCYEGSTAEPYLVKLIDAETTSVSADDLNLFQIIQPDYMLFKHNPYFMNSHGTRIAGKPDLIVEVWSKDNSESHRNFKKLLYSTSSVTEHWYIEQNSNEVECWFSDKQLPYQSLNNILKTQQNIEIDLRYLALD